MLVTTGSGCTLPTRGDKPKLLTEAACQDDKIREQSSAAEGFRVAAPPSFVCEWLLWGASLTSPVPFSKYCLAWAVGPTALQLTTLDDELLLMKGP